MKKKTRKRLRKWYLPFAFVLGGMAVYFIMFLQAHLNLVDELSSVIKVQRTQLEQAQRAAPRGPAPRPPTERPPAQ